MQRFMLGGLAAAMSLLTLSDAIPATSDARLMPMQFQLEREGPAEACGNSCRTWISAVGTITADTPRVFDAFAKNRDLRGALIVLDSEGGSVLGAMSFG